MAGKDRDNIPRTGARENDTAAPALIFKEF